MKQFAGRTAIVTGAGSGIGSGIARALARAGMQVAVADIQRDNAQATCGLIEADGGKAIAIAVDVSDAASVEAAADQAEAAFGPIHVAVNNAGVAMHGTPLEKISLEDWNWVIGVNVYGVIHGIRSFVPRIRRHGQGGHVVNTASIGGLQVNPDWHTGAYSMTKYAVVALSEALEQELQGTGIGVSVFCPAAVRSNLFESAKNRPERMGGAFVREQQHFLKEATAEGLTPIEAGERVLRGIEDGEFLILSHAEPRPWVEKRHERIMAAFDRAEEIAALAGKPRA
jgi:NAD(P)-dependent dehydrogenase (short-subunit alcohol dehydrogenase family)